LIGQLSAVDEAEEIIGKQIFGDLMGDFEGESGDLRVNQVRIGFVEDSVIC
jgi:hypothetical protein